MVEGVFFSVMGAVLLLFLIVVIRFKCCWNGNKDIRRNNGNQQERAVAVYSADGSSRIYYIHAGDLGGGHCHTNGGFDSGGGHHWSGGGHTDSGGGGCDSGGGGGGGGDCGGGVVNSEFTSFHLRSARPKLFDLVITS